MKIHQRSVKGFTLTEVMIVVAIIGLIAAIAIPNFVKMRTRAQANTCIENLKQIEAAKQMFGAEKGRKNGDVVNDSDIFGPLLYLRQKPACSAGGTISLNVIGTNASCSLAADGHIL